MNQISFNNCQWITAQQKQQELKLKNQNDMEKKKTYESQRIKLILPGKRWGHICIIFENQMFLFGGMGQTQISKNIDAVYALNLDNFEWTQYYDANKPLPDRRDSFSACKIGNSFIIFGGSNQNEVMQDMWSFNFQNKLWTQINQKGDIPCKREGHSTIQLFDRYIFLFGGLEGQNLFNDSYLYDNENQTWQQINLIYQQKPQKRESFSMVSIKENIYIFGGQGINEFNNQDQYFNDFWVFKFQICRQTGICSGYWQQQEINGDIISRTSNTATLYKDRYIIIIGGEKEFKIENNNNIEIDEIEKTIELNQQQNVEIKCQPLNDIHIYDSETNKIIQIEPKSQDLFTSRFVHTACIYNDNLIIYGGLTDYNTSLDDLLILELIQDSERNGKKLELKDICNNCKDEIKYPINVYYILIKMELFQQEQQIQDLYSFNASLYFLQKSSQLINSSIIAIKKIIEFTIKNKSDFIQIYLQLTKPSIFDQKILEQNLQMKQQKQIQNQTYKKFIIFDFGGKLYNAKELQEIMINFNSEINLFAQNLKINALRIGSSFMIISKNEELITISMISTNIINNCNIEKYSYYLSSWNDKEYLTFNGYQNKKNIYDTILGYMDESEIIPQNNSNRLIIFDLKILQKSMSYEINFDKQQDIILNQPKLSNRQFKKDIQNSLLQNIKFYFANYNNDFQIYIKDQLIQIQSYLQQMKNNSELLLIYNEINKDFFIDIFVTIQYIDHKIQKQYEQLQLEYNIQIDQDFFDLTYKELILKFKNIYQEIQYNIIEKNQENYESLGILIYQNNILQYKYENNHYNSLNSIDYKISNSNHFQGIINFKSNLKKNQQIDIYQQIDKKIKKICNEIIKITIDEKFQDIIQNKKIKI